MKKILILILIVFSLMSCKCPIGKGDYFIVTKVEEWNSPAYEYIVTIRTAYSESWDCYEIITDKNYRVGDTLKITLK